MLLLLVALCRTTATTATTTTTTSTTTTTTIISTTTATTQVLLIENKAEIIHQCWTMASNEVSPVSSKMQQRTHHQAVTRHSSWTMPQIRSALQWIPQDMYIEMQPGSTISQQLEWLPDQNSGLVNVQSLNKAYYHPPCLWLCWIHMATVTVNKICTPASKTDRQRVKQRTNQKSNQKNNQTSRNRFRKRKPIRKPIWKLIGN